MEYIKLTLYFIFFLVSLKAILSLDIKFKKSKIADSRFLILLITMSITYLSVNYITDLVDLLLKMFTGKI